MALKMTELTVGMRRDEARRLGIPILRDDAGKENVVVHVFPQVVDLDKKTACDEDHEELVNSGIMTLGEIAYAAVWFYRTEIANKMRNQLREGEAKRLEREAREKRTNELIARLQNGDVTAAAELKALLAK